jgi:hypothetical protein
MKDKLMKITGNMISFDSHGEIVLGNIEEMEVEQEEENEIEMEDESEEIILGEGEGEGEGQAKQTDGELEMEDVKGEGEGEGQAKQTEASAFKSHEDLERCLYEELTTLMIDADKLERQEETERQAMKVDSNSDNENT